MYSAIEFDESGAAFPDAYAGFFTATDDDGVRSGAGTTCADWTNDTTGVAVDGSRQRTTANWTSDGTSSCGATRGLICLETLAGPRLPPVNAIGRVAFITGVAGTSDLGSWPDGSAGGGIPAGDAICQARAAAAGLDEPQSFKAWLSSGAVDAIDRFTRDGRWVRPDGIPVAENKVDLTDRELFAPINVTAVATT